MTLHEMFSLRRADGRARLCILASECLKAIYTALTTGVFLTGFLLASGADNVSVSVITSVPLISGILYPLGPLLLERFRRRKVLLGAFRLAFHGFTILGVTLLPLLVPLFVSSFRRADELAVAMESRCYHGGEGRTRMNSLHMARRDVLAFLAGAVVLGAMIAMNVYGI